jgi:hypothetical protein
LPRRTFLLLAAVSPQHQRLNILLLLVALVVDMGIQMVGKGLAVAALAVIVLQVVLQ